MPVALGWREARKQNSKLPQIQGLNFHPLPIRVPIKLCFVAHFSLIRTKIVRKQNALSVSMFVGGERDVKVKK